MASLSPAAAPEAALDAAIAAAGDAEGRRAAFARFLAAPLPAQPPNRRWKHDLARLDLSALAPVAGNNAAHSQAARAIPLGAVSAHAALADGDVAIVRAPSVPGLTVCDFATARAEHGEAFARAFGTALRDDDRFGQLAAALHLGGLFVRVSAGTRVEDPILIYSAALAADAFPYVVVLVEAGAAATVVEAGLGGGEGRTVVPVLEAVVDDEAELAYAAVQEYDAGTRVLATRRARAGRDATVRIGLAELGATLALDDTRIRTEARGARAEVSGFFLAAHDQHVDLTTEVAHVVGDTTSDTVVKSAARDRAQARYLGNILITPGAHGADASLKDDVLLLSEGAHIDSVPALEIAANEVSAFHGATVGAISDEVLFYAESRGIARDEAERLITLGFFAPAVDRFPIEALREHLRGALAAALTAR